MLKRSIDLGGSQVRIGSSDDPIMEIDSLFLEIPLTSPAKAYIEDKYADFIIEKHPLVSLCSRRFVRGEAMDHFQGTLQICDNQKNKVEQESIYANAAYAIARHIDHLYSYDEDIELSVCIPTSEFYSDKKDYPGIFKKGMAGEHSIFFPLLNRRVVFNINKDNIKVFPEGVVAAFKFKDDKAFAEGVTLIVDVGYRSTDITILKRFRPVGKSAVSRPKGGINIEAALLAELERDNILVSREEVRGALCSKYVLCNGKYVDATDIFERYQSLPEAERIVSILHAIRDLGYTATEDAVVEADRNNYINHENVMVDITKQVVAAKRNFASSIKGDIVDVLATQMLNLGSVNNIMPVGRPFIGGIKNENSLAAILCKELNSNLRYYALPNLATANVEMMIEVVG